MLLFRNDNLPHYGLERVFEIAKETKFAGMEIVISPNLDTQTPAYLKKLEKRFSLPIKAFSLSNKHEENLKEAFQNTVKEFSGVAINLASPRNFSFGYKQWLNNTVPLLAKKYNLQLRRVNAPFTNMIGIIPTRIDNSMMALKSTNAVCLDLGALAASGNDIIKAVAFLGDSLKCVQISNFYHNSPYGLPQQGVLPIESLLAKLKQTNYKGEFVLRVSSKYLHESEPTMTKQSLEEVQQFFQKYFQN